MQTIPDHKTDKEVTRDYEGPITGSDLRKRGVIEARVDAEIIVLTEDEKKRRIYNRNW